MRLPRTKILSLFVLAVLIYSLFLILKDDASVVDFIQYWAGSIALVSNGNPYDSSTIAMLEHSIWRAHADPILMWNPPQVGLLIFFLSFFEYQTARLIWLLLEAALVAFSIKLTFQLISSWRTGFVAYKPLHAIFLLTFYPALLAISEGQISPFLLFGLVLFLYFEFGPNKNPLFAGLGLSITLIKPHLLYLIYLAVIVQSLRTKRFSLLIWFCAGAVALSVFPLIFNVDIYSKYSQAMGDPPLYWQTPTLGSYIQWLAIFPDRFARFFPTILCAIAMVTTWILKRTELPLNVFLALIPLSVLTSPYGWVFDQMLLLPLGVSLLFCRDKCSSLKPCLFLVLSNILMMVIPSEFGQQAFIWYPLVYLLTWVISQKENAVKAAIKGT